MDYIYSIQYEERPNYEWILKSLIKLEVRNSVVNSMKMTTKEEFKRQKSIYQAIQN